MARRTSDVGVEECKDFSSLNDHTASTSSTPLPLGSWNLNNGTRPTESQRSAGMARIRQGTPSERNDSACMMLTKNVCRAALLYNTWEALFLLQVNTVVSR